MIWDIGTLLLKLFFVFQVNLEGNKVRRQLPIGNVPSDVDSRTVYVVTFHVLLLVHF